MIDYAKAWRKKYPARYNAMQRRYYRANVEHMRELKRAQWHKHKHKYKGRIRKPRNRVNPRVMVVVRKLIPYAGKERGN